MQKDNETVVVGWREWLSLPQAGIPAIKAKIDTGARTSALHTFQIETFRDKGIPCVRFGIHPLQRRRTPELFCTAGIVDRRRVTDSGGHSEMRYVIETLVRLGEYEWPIEITLTDRENMRFRMLLGRAAMQRNFVVKPTSSYLAGRELARYYRNQNKKRSK